MEYALYPHVFYSTCNTYVFSYGDLKYREGLPFDVNTHSFPPHHTHTHTHAHKHTRTHTHEHTFLDPFEEKGEPSSNLTPTERWD